MQIIMYITIHKSTHKLNDIHNEGGIINKTLRPNSEDAI